MLGIALSDKVCVSPLKIFTTLSRLKHFRDPIFSKAGAALFVRWGQLHSIEVSNEVLFYECQRN